MSRDHWAAIRDRSLPLAIYDHANLTIKLGRLASQIVQLKETIENKNTEITLLKDLVGTKYRKGVNPIETLIQTADEYDISVAELTGSSCCRQLSHARHHAMWRLKEKGMSLAEIGRVMNRDHTTVLYGVRAHHKREQVPESKEFMKTQAPTHTDYGSCT